LDLFLSFEGRIGRRQWWIGLIVLSLVSFLVNFAVVILVGMGTAGRLAMLTVTLLFLWPAAALAAKRLADQDKQAMPRLALWFGPGLLWSVLQSSGIGYRRAPAGPGMPDMLEPGMAPTALMALSVIVFFWMVIELGFLPGRDQGRSQG